MPLRPFFGRPNRSELHNHATTHVVRLGSDECRVPPWQRPSRLGSLLRIVRTTTTGVICLEARHASRDGHRPHHRDGPSRCASLFLALDSSDPKGLIAPPNRLQDYLPCAARTPRQTHRGGAFIHPAERGGRVEFRTSITKSLTDLSGKGPTHLAQPDLRSKAGTGV